MAAGLPWALPVDNRSFTQQQEDGDNLVQGMVALPSLLTGGGALIQGGRWLVGRAAAGAVTRAAQPAIGGASSHQVSNLARQQVGHINQIVEVPIFLSKSRFGHTFTTHGENMTTFLIHRARGSGQAQGQFLDNQAAARFILNNLNRTANGAVNIPMPAGLRGRFIMPDGTFANPTHIRLVPSGNGVTTAYPLIL